jgi:tetratricopeptide (TPR) repeat protein
MATIDRPVPGQAQADEELPPVWTGSAPPLADGFIARGDTGHFLEAALVPGATVALVPDGAAAGPRGWRDSSGKTQLAVYCAQSLWQAAAVDLVIWIPGTGREQVLSGYAEAAAALGVQLTGDAESVATRFLSWLRGYPRPWLVVVDNLTDAALMAGLWPEGPAGRVLVTAADSAAIAELDARPIPVGAFSRREALTYLVGRLATDLDQRQGALDLVGDLGGEPLALALASAVIASSELTCHDYREHFLRRREQLAGAAAVAVAEPAAGAIAWALSVDHAEMLAPGSAQSLLMLAALLDGNGIPGTVFTTSAVGAYCPPDGAYSVAGGAVRDGLTALEHAGLLSADPSSTPPLMRMSWLVQTAVRSAMPGTLLKDAATVAADALLEAWPADDPPEWLARALRSCTESLWRWSGDLLWEGGVHALLMRAGASFDAALTGPAVSYWEELAATSSRVLGEDHPATVGIGQRLARAYLAAGRASESVALLERIRGERARRAGPDHPGSVQAGRDLGLALVTANRFREAIGVLAEVANGWGRSAGADSIEAISAREDLAAANRAAGEFSDAITQYRDVLKDRERIQGRSHPDVTATCRELADTYLAAGQSRAAIAQYERVVSDRERALGAGHLHTIAARGALGSAYHAAGRMTSAVRLYKQTRTEYIRVLGADHPDTLGASVNLAHAYYAVGRVSDAETLLRETIGRCELSLPASDPLTVSARTSLANISEDANQATAD